MQVYRFFLKIRDRPQCKKHNSVRVSLPGESKPASTFAFRNRYDRDNVREWSF